MCAGNSVGGGLDRNTDRKIYKALKYNLLSQKYYFKAVEKLDEYF